VSQSEIPKDVTDFIAAHIDSVVRLEVLLLLHARPGVSMEAADIARELRIDTDWTKTALEALEAIGVLARDASRYRYAPRTPELAQTMDALSHAYADRRVSIISLIFSRPTDPIRHFTDAFRFRKD
jgi:hypothetical protein